jgi:hypothetical protein
MEARAALAGTAGRHGSRLFSGRAKALQLSWRATPYLAELIATDVVGQVGSGARRRVPPGRARERTDRNRDARGDPTI